MMIETAEEFLRLRFSDDQATARRATTEEAPLEVWRELVQSVPEARFWVAQNKTVPGEILELLARDSDVRVRWMVASKRKVAIGELALLSDDPDETVRLAVARNARTPDDVLVRLVSDPVEEVRNVATSRLGFGG